MLFGSCLILFNNPQGLIEISKKKRQSKNMLSRKEKLFSLEENALMNPSKGPEHGMIKKTGSILIQC